MLCGWSSNSGSPNAWKPGTDGGALAPAGAAFAVPPAAAFSISDFTTRPCGPEPTTRDRSSPCCCARRLASGLAKIRLPEAATGAGAGAAGDGAAADFGASALAAPSPLEAGTGASAAFGAGAALEALMSPGLSPSSSSTAITSLTFTPCAPSGTRILPILPSSTASTSMVALSVSISAITSPAFTASPSFFSQRARLPSVMVGERAGIRILIGMARPPLLVGDALGGFDDVLGLRQRQLLEIGGVGHRHVRAVHAHHRRVEPVEHLLHRQGRQLGADAGKRPALLHGDQPVGALHRIDDGLGVERANGAQVDDLGFDALLREFLGR